MKTDLGVSDFSGVDPLPMILAVDDQRDYLDALEALLSGEGYDVRTTTSVAEALRKARALTPCVLVTDLNMHPCDGIRLLRLLVEHDLLRDIPKVILSSAPREVVRGCLRDAGVDAEVIDKNGEVGVLLATLDRLCRERTARPPASAPPASAPPSSAPPDSAPPDSAPPNSAPPKSEG